MTQQEIIEMARKIANEASKVGSYRTWTHEYAMNLIMQLVEASAAKEREAITEEYWSCVQSDLEHGVKCLNEEASKLFHISMPELSKFGVWLEARGEA